MSSRFTVLASGSSGNASLLQTPRGGLLLDCGLPPQELSQRLDKIGVSWSAVNAVVITHTHSDHWNRYTLEHLRRLSIPLYAHPQHQAFLTSVPAFLPLQRAKLVNDYLPGVEFHPIPQLCCMAVHVPHDSDPTFAIRCNSAPNAEGNGWSVGLASDLGTLTQDFLNLFAGVDVLAIEFNHDERLERSSRRPRFLVNRVLSDLGHLSNTQAAEAVRLLADAIAPHHLQAVVQLHLSRECNTADLAQAAARSLWEHAPQKCVRIITAKQHEPVESVVLNAGPQRAVRVPVLAATVEPKPRMNQLILPGMDDA